MRFGIDFGTTRTVMAAVDRGNYPVVHSADPEGDFFDYLPSVVAIDTARGGKVVAGWEALALEGVEYARSFKRILSGEDVTARTPVRIGDELRPISEVLLAFAEEVASQLRRYQAELGDASATEAVLGVPANASSAQRLLTMDAFTRAGVRVLGLVNEPSAAAFEYSHRHERTLNTKRSSILVYDLGGGTFDVSLIKIDGSSHEVITSRGVSRLGGDDFDELLLSLALAKAGRKDDALGRRANNRLLEEARTAKEQLKPQSRRLILDVADTDVTVPVTEFYDEADALVTLTMDLLSDVVGHEESLTDTDIAGIYLVGGASALPLIPRALRERYARRVHRSPLPGASTAVGLAIAADPESDFHLLDRRGRGIGVFRERDGGAGVAFDPLVELSASPDEDGVTRVVRRYEAAHNIGVFRFVEYTSLDDKGQPGDMSVLCEVTVPFDRNLPPVAQLKDVPVERRDGGPEVVEHIRVSPDGIAKVAIEVPAMGMVVTK